MRDVPRRLAVSAVSSWRWSFDEDLRFWTAHGIDHVGLSLRKCEEVGLDVAARRVRDGGLRVSNFVECGWCEPADPNTWTRYRERLLAAVDAAGALGGAVVVLTTGPAGPLEWDAAATALADALTPVLAAARAKDVPLAIENTGSLRLDLSFVTTLADACDLAARLRCGVCVEVNSCWAERDLERTLALHAERLAHVQLSDWRIGSHCTPDRSVPGDGDIPLARLLRMLDAVGYGGAFELELVGPRIEDEGYERAIPRAVERASALLREALAEDG
jgi:sugar phosphate isomerase/epimerase